ncbi:MAG TPA: alpha/beta hydrolase [Nocardioides sp.]|uniref:alpha/beta hydrolase n=1 Tax=Nocardioides sp. TaxID=35761 RepID=UPI002F409190
MSGSPFLAALDQRAKAIALRAALGLPERVQRVLGGRPVTIDGQTLAFDTQLMLRLERIVREPSSEDLPLDAGRRLMVKHTAIAGGNQPIGSVRDLTVGDRRARLYVPSGAASPGPLLVFFHGGGWVYGDLDSHDAPCRFLAERSGVRVLSVEYRLAPEHPFPDGADDAMAAYRWVTEHAASLDADVSRLGVGGDSAGGNLAAVTAIGAAREGLALAFQLLVYPGTDATHDRESKRLFGSGFYLTREFMDDSLDRYVPDPAMRADPRVSPLLADVPAGLAPAYVATAGFDPLRDEGEAYARKLAEAGVEVELRRFPDQIHGFLNVVGAGRTARAASAEVAARLAVGLRSRRRAA